MSLERYFGQPYAGHMTTYRTPPSLSWLLDNRRRIAGQIEKIEEKLAKFGEKYARAKIIVDQHDIHLPRVIRALKADLRSLDQTIGLHQVAVDLDLALVPPIREQVRRQRYGNMTPTIHSCFALAPREWKTTNEIATFVTSKRYPDIRDYEFPDYRDAVHRHLKAMQKRGQVEQMLAKGIGKQSLWRGIKMITGLTAHTDDDSLGNSRETTGINPLEISSESGPQNAV